MADVILEPLNEIFERSWSTGKLPEDWKRADVVPVFKKGGKGGSRKLQTNQFDINPWENPRSTWITCMSQEVRLRSLTTREARKERTRNRAFSAVAPRLWNNLPPEIRTAPTLDTFKSQLKTWLYIQAFPPVHI